MKKYLLLLSSFALFQAVSAETCKAPPNPEDSERYSPGYSLGYEYPLKNLADDSLSTESFHLQVSKPSNIAYLMIQHYSPEAISQRRKVSDPPTFEDSVTVFKSGHGWCKLTISDCTKIFGSPRTKSNYGSPFYTFDVWSADDSLEKQLYHIDIKFDPTGVITAYRLRGIGVPNPQWVDK